jgi:hypothetical protein
MRGPARRFPFAGIVRIRLLGSPSRLSTSTASQPFGSLARLAGHFQGDSPTRLPLGTKVTFSKAKDRPEQAPPRDNR